MNGQIEERHKAIAIPVCIAAHADRPRFLTVRDRRFKDWIFVAGGCRKREVQNPLKCALRELEEETRGVISLKEGQYTTFTFKTHNRTDEELRDDKRRGIHVISVYHVFIFFVTLTETEQLFTVDRFNQEKSKMDSLKEKRLPIKRTYDENDMMSWTTLDDFSQRKQWDIIKTNVLGNPEFFRKLYEKPLNFNIKRNYTYNASKKSIYCNRNVVYTGNGNVVR